MSFRLGLILSFFGLVVAITVANFQSAPGYMDADYYMVGGMQLGSGKGFQEPILWNYLDQPNSIPHPSHGYWMPLASILAALGVKILGNNSFSGGRLVFLFLFSLIPSMTAYLTYEVISNKRASVLTGLLAIFSGFYLPFLTTTDTFALYMLLGILFILVIGKSAGKYLNKEENYWYVFALGIIVGLMHLARADGLLWLFVAIVVFIQTHFNKRSEPGVYSRILKKILLLIVGYLLIMGPWLARNIIVFGTPLAPGGVKALWLLDYNELFAYPASLLTPARWWRSGLNNLLSDRLWALGQNIQTFIAVQGSIFLLPLIVLGLWNLRKRTYVKVGVLSWLLILFVMTFVFPFPGARGGFFHSGGAIQPLFWAVVPKGLETFVDWGSRARGWKTNQALTVFTQGLIVFAMLMTGFIGYQRFNAPNPNGSEWDQSYDIYDLVEDKIVEAGAKEQDILMVNNPPGYFFANSRPSIVIPDGNEEVLIEAAIQFGARFVVLEPNHPEDLISLYQNPRSSDELKYLQTVSGTHIFEIQSP